MVLKCVYTDLDGTLLGKWGSLFRTADGEFSQWQAKAIEACYRADVEIVIKSGRREAQVLEDARLIGQTAYVYEAGCGVVIDGEKTVLIGDLKPEEGKSVAETIADAGVPQMLFDAFPGRLEYHTPWASERQLSHLFRGKIDADEANAVLKQRGHGALRLIDNGAIFRPMEGIEGPVHAYHLLPAAASKAGAVAFHQRARGFEPEQCIAIGDSVEDLGVAPVVERFFVPSNGPERDAGLAEAISRTPNATVTEAPMGEGVYEAIVSTLAGA
ncbi:MAG: HAD hydrolase family protein [Solirubrobacterales bacterium]